MIILITIGWIYFIFTGIRLFVVLLNFVSQPYLKKAKATSFRKKVSVLIPARNEEKNIGFLLEKLTSQSYPIFEIIVYNDQSTDNTQEIAESFVRKNPNIKIIQGLELPTNWLGKNHACYQLAKNASGDYYLFLDADVIPKETLIEKALARIEKHDLKLLSIFPKQIMHSFGERLVVPLMHNILLSLLPLFYVRRSNRVSFAAANGQFMMFEAKTYKRIQPHSWVKSKVVEDIEINRLYKKFHLKTETLLGNHAIDCHMYNGFSDAINGFSKNIKKFFSNSSFFMIFYTLLCLLGWIGLFFLPNKLFITSIAILIVYHLVLNVLAGRNVGNLLLIPAQTVTTFIVALKNIYSNKTKSLTWKGRRIK